MSLIRWCEEGTALADIPKELSLIAWKSNTSWRYRQHRQCSYQALSRHRLYSMFNTEEFAMQRLDQWNMAGTLSSTPLHRGCRRLRGIGWLRWSVSELWFRWFNHYIELCHWGRGIWHRAEEISFAGRRLGLQAWKCIRRQEILPQGRRLLAGWRYFLNQKLRFLIESHFGCLWGDAETSSAWQMKGERVCADYIFTTFLTALFPASSFRVTK
jgi:hypothetical protein